MHYYIIYTIYARVLTLIKRVKLLTGKMMMMIKLEIVIFECPRYSWIKEEKLLKVWGAPDWEISSTFWEKTGHFPLGLGPKFGPKQPWKISACHQLCDCGLRWPFNHDLNSQGFLCSDNIHVYLSEVCKWSGITSKRIHGQRAKSDFMTQIQWGSSFHCHKYKIWNWSCKTCSLYSIHKVIFSHHVFFRIRSLTNHVTNLSRRRPF